MSANEQGGSVGQRDEGAGREDGQGNQGGSFTVSLDSMPSWIRSLVLMIVRFVLGIALAHVEGLRGLARAIGGDRAVAYVNGTSATGPVAAPVQDTHLRRRWYVVFRGRNVGVFDNQSVFYLVSVQRSLTSCYVRYEVDDATLGVPGQSQRRFRTREAADEAYSQALQRGNVHVVDVDEYV